jgi:gliding motility-associated-like protein
MVKLPNAFTPNGDGLNDEFKLLNTSNFVDFHLWIYNRRGEIVFDTRDVNQGWDGTVEGEPRYAESFVWQMTYSYLNQYRILVNETDRGMVSLIR